MRTISLGRKAKIKLIGILLIVLLTYIGDGLAHGPNDVQTNEHTFIYIGADTPNDLHVEYNKDIGFPATDALVTVVGGATYTGHTRTGSTLNINGSFPAGTGVKVHVHSAATPPPVLQVKEYWWTLGGSQIGPKIPVKYYTSPAINKDGNFEHGETVDKPCDHVMVKVTGTENIKGGVGGVQVLKQPADGGTKTKVTFKGQLADPKKKGKVTAIIDPPEFFEDWDIDIFPFPEPYPIGYNTTWLVVTLISLMLAGGYLILRQRRKMAKPRLQ